MPSCLPAFQKLCCCSSRLGAGPGQPPGHPGKFRHWACTSPFFIVLGVCRHSRILASLSLSRTDGYHRNRRASHQERVPRSVLHAYAAAALNV